MQWQVDGADRTTGEDKAFLIDADTEAQARAIAEAHGLYVSAAAPYVDPDYTPTPEQAAAAAAPDPEPEPEPTPALPPPAPARRQQSRYAATQAPPPAATAAYAQETIPYARPGASAGATTFADVPGAARRLRAADLVLSIFGWLYVVLGVVGGLITVVLILRAPSGFVAAPLIGTLAVPLGLIALGVVFLGIGAALRMLAAIGIATTEIARRKS